MGSFNHDESEKFAKLGRDNYFHWSLRAQSALEDKGYWSAIDPGFGEQMSSAEKNTNRKALTFLYWAVSDVYLEDIGSLERAKDAWAALKEIHVSDELLHLVIILKEMVNVEKTEDISMQEYMSRIQSANRKLKEGGIELGDKVVATVFLAGLPQRYNGLIRPIQKQDLCIREVKSKLLIEGSTLRQKQRATFVTKTGRRRWPRMADPNLAPSGPAVAAGPATEDTDGRLDTRPVTRMTGNVAIRTGIRIRLGVVPREDVSSASPRTTLRSSVPEAMGVRIINKTGTKTVGIRRGRHRPTWRNPWPREPLVDTPTNMSRVRTTCFTWTLGLRTTWSMTGS